MNIMIHFYNVWTVLILALLICRSVENREKDVINIYTALSMLT